MTNHEIADQFELLSKLMDIHGADSFRAKSYASAAFRIEKLPEQVADLSFEQLKALPAIGASLAKKIEEINTTGRLSALSDMLEQTPSGVVEMLQIKGIGPKKIALLWQELGIESIGELEYACQENRLLSLKGFGAKTQSAILASIQFIKDNSGFSLYAELHPVVEKLIAYYQNKFPNAMVSTSGDYRMQNLVLNRVDWISTLNKEEILSAFVSNLPQVEEAGDLLTIRLEGLPPFIFTKVAAGDYFLNLFQQSGTSSFLQAFQTEFEYPEEITSEEAIFEHNSLPFIPPALRNSEDILEKKEMPELIQPEDIKGIIHSHSTYSDGLHSLSQMAMAAKDKGYEYLVISDHSQAAFYANGLSPERIAQQHMEIDQLNQQLAPFKIFKSIEADILNDGQLDYDATVLASLDLVIASVHSNLKMTEEKAMQRILRAIENPATRILGHPTGRLLLSRAGYPVDHKILIDACAANDVVIEINAHPRRLDLDWSWINYALEKGVTLSINPDAHSIDGMDLVQYGVYAAQKGGLTKTHNLSSFSLVEMEAFVAKTK